MKIWREGGVARNVSKEKGNQSLKLWAAHSWPGKAYIANLSAFPRQLNLTSSSMEFLVISSSNNFCEKFHLVSLQKKTPCDMLPPYIHHLCLSSKSTNFQFCVTRPGYGCKIQALRKVGNFLFQSFCFPVSANFWEPTETGSGPSISEISWKNHQI